MVGRIRFYQEKGKGSVGVEYLDGLTLITAALYVPPGLSQRRLNRRLAKLERQLAGMGVGRVVLPEGFPYADRLGRLRPVDTLGFYRAVADVLALEALGRVRADVKQGRVTLSAPWLCPELRRTAQRLCPQVRAIRIDVPQEEGEAYAKWLQRQYGLPVAPRSGQSHVTVAFRPGERGQGWTLRLYDRPWLGGLRLYARDLELPWDCDQQLLALLWEEGVVKREALYAGPPAIEEPHREDPPCNKTGAVI